VRSSPLNLKVARDVCSLSRLTNSALAALAISDATSAKDGVAMKKTTATLRKRTNFMAGDCADDNMNDKQIAPDFL
jgi:hypothetical protein